MFTELIFESVKDDKLGAENHRHFNFTKYMNYFYYVSYNK